MKKQQILALIMAGTIVTGMAPAAVFGETDAPAVSIEGEAAVAAESEEGAVVEEAPTEGTDASQTEDVPAETPTQEPAAEPTQAPVETPAAEPTAEPTQEPASIPDEVFGDGDTAEMESLEEDGIAVQDAGQIVMKKPDGTQATYGTLAEAIAAADQNVNVADTNAVTQIFVTGTIELTETVVIDGQRSISIAAGAAGAQIKRAESFSGDMFKVTGGSAFQFGSGKDEAGNILDLTVSGYSSTLPDAGGSIVLVETNSSFGMNDGVTLSGNRTATAGAAIRNIGGTVGLSGGTITDNQSLDEENGSVIYSEGNAAADESGNYKGDILISGNVTISDDADRALVLNNNGVIRVVGALGSTTSLRYLVNDPQDGRCVVQAADGIVMADVLNQIVYIGDAQYTVDANGYLKAATTPVESTMELKVVKANGEGVSWVSDTEASLSFHATELGKYYVKVIKQTDKMPTFAEVKASVAAQDVGTTKITVALTNLDSTSDLYVVVYAEDSRGLEAKKNLVLPLKARATADPTATPTPTTRPALTPKVTESTVTGLENPLEFYPGKTYSFTVKGAGSDNTDPVNGDVRWVPLYWSSYKNPTSQSQKQSIGTIGHKTGIKRAATFNMYIFFQKYVYDGTQWQPTDVIESMTYQFKSKAIEFEISPTGTITPTVTDGNGGGSYSGGDSSGDGDDVTDPEDHADDGSDTGSSSATNARTADNSPIATMMMLASLSLLAGGYVLVRKRKKEI